MSLSLRNKSIALTHLGGESCVTGSCHLLQAQGLNILVDCGLAQGDDTLLPIAEWPIQPQEVDYLFFTHAHIDHIGRLPELLQNGFEGEIICSHPTKALLLPMLSDAMSFGSLDSREAEKLSGKIDDLSWGFEFQQEFKLKKGITFKLGRAGHILGSSFIRFEIPGTTSQKYVIVFSGDLGNKNTPILPDPDPPETCDLLILESTYGNRLHEGREDRLERLAEKLRKALVDNGKVFIPAFSLGRTQEILFELDSLFDDNNSNIKNIPVFVDSPLGLKLTKIYGELSHYWDSESKEFLREGDHPFDFDNLYGVARFKDHKKLLEIPGPAIIIAGSGMCTGGRILDHLAQGLSETNNDIFFVGYQAPGTLGYDIVKYAEKPGGYVWLGEDKTIILANVEQLTGYSAHADQNGLLDWVESMSIKPGQIKLIHGDSTARMELHDKLIQLGHNVT